MTLTRISTNRHSGSANRSRVLAAFGFLPLAGLLFAACAVDDASNEMDDEEETVDDAEALSITPSYECCTSTSCREATATSACRGVRFTCNDVGCSAGDFRLTHAEARANGRILIAAGSDPKADVWDDPWAEQYGDECALWNELYNEPCPSGGGGAGPDEPPPGPAPPDDEPDWKCTKCNLTGFLCTIGCFAASGPAAGYCVYQCLETNIACAQNYCE